MGTNWTKAFVRSTGAILLASALIRFLIAASNAPFLSLPDPAIGIPLRYSVLIAGGIEFLVAFICLFGERVNLQIGWLAWLATNFIVFRIGLFWMHCHPQATCIGSLTDPLHLSRGMTGMIVALLPVYLALGSYTALIWLWFVAPKHSEGDYGVVAGLIKISCPACGGHIKFAALNLGLRIPCPHCRSAIILREPETLKMSCVSCGGHIEFPSYAVGQRILCPHCSKTITLLAPA